MLKITNEQFIARARKIHGDKYDYSEIKYINSSTKIKIICKIHGEFIQYPHHHLKGCGCIKCGRIITSNKQRKEVSNFIDEAKRIHNGYDYSKVIYLNNHTKIKIICLKHGVFEQTPDSHLRGSGCPICGGTSLSNTECFIEKAKKIHGDRYDYSKSEYIGSNKKIKIICYKHGEFWQRTSNHLSGRGCPLCGGSSLSNTECFIEKAKKIHGSRYDYLTVKYINNHIKVKIKCLNHGYFWQIPGCHLYGQGCPICAGNVALNTETFVKKAKLIHGNKYDYSKVSYVNSNIKVEIICPEHGSFEQGTYNHLSGNGCLICSINNKKLNIEEFINRAKETHNNRYKYSEVDYINSYTKVKIFCPEHGVFEQDPHSHLKGHGCPICANNSKSLTTEDFIKRANEKHNHKYDYSEVNYRNTHTKVKIICPEHGMFKQTPQHHLNGSNCPKCVSSVSKRSQLWLDYLNIPEEWREKIIHIGAKWYKVDAFDPVNMVIYEFNGDFWHGNPDVFNLDDINPITKTTYRTLYEKTEEKKGALISAGYKVVSIWENDFIKGV